MPEGLLTEGWWRLTKPDKVMAFLSDTLKLVSAIQATGVTAVAVHSLTKEQRPGGSNDVASIKAVVQYATIPLIANGGFSQNRNAQDNTYEGIRQLWRASGVSSVMIARAAAEWNLSVFRPGPLDNVMTVIKNTSNMRFSTTTRSIIVKYCLQQLLGSLQDSELGRDFLNNATIRDLCLVFRHSEL